MLLPCFWLKSTSYFFLQGFGFSYQAGALDEAYITQMYDKKGTQWLVCCMMMMTIRLRIKKIECWYICCFLIGSELSNTKLLYFRPLFFSFKCSALGIVQVVKRYFNTLAPSTTTSWLHQRSYKIDTLLLCLFFSVETSNICQCRTEWGGICDYRISSLNWSLDLLRRIFSYCIVGNRNTAFSFQYDEYN